jgi:hypothetical protein
MTFRTLWVSAFVIAAAAAGCKPKPPAPEPARLEAELDAKGVPRLSPCEIVKNSLRYSSDAKLAAQVDQTCAYHRHLAYQMALEYDARRGTPDEISADDMAHRFLVVQVAAMGQILQAGGHDAEFTAAPAVQP